MEFRRFRNSARRALWTAALCACASLAVQAAQSPAAQSFVNKAAQAGMAEVALGKVAMARSEDPKIRDFASRMVDDHSKANDELASIARNENIDVPSQLDAEHRGVLEDLSAKTGMDFDAAYSQQMAADHAQAVDLFRVVSTASDLPPDLVSFASKTLPTVEEHKKMADALAANAKLGKP